MNARPILPNPFIATRIISCIVPSSRAFFFPNVRDRISNIRHIIILYMELYHVLNRGVEKRTIFLDSQDHARFVHDLYEFNDTAPAENTHRSGMFEIRSRTLERETIVDIHGWCLMGNHYHLLLSEQ